MEPDVVRLYSSSPPPLDEGGEEEDEDEFGDFGGYCSGLSASFSFSEFDTPTTAIQSHASETSPPDLYISSVQNVSSSGKNVTSEEDFGGELQASLSISKPLVNENSVSTDDCENGEPEVSEIVINGVLPSDLKGAPSVLSSTVQHRSSSNPVPQDFVGSGVSRQCDLSIGGGVQSLSNGHGKLNIGTTVGDSTVTNSPDIASRAESSNYTTAPSADDHFQISQENVSEFVGGVVAEMASEFQEIGSSNTSGDQSIGERREQQEQEELSTGSQVPSGEENIASSGDVMPKSGSEDFGEVSDAQLCKDSVDRTTTELPRVVHSTETVGEDFEKVSGTTTDFTVEVVRDAEVDEDFRNQKGATNMDEEFGDFRDAVGVDFSRTESATQEGFADFVTALSGCSTDDDFGETDTLKDWKEEEDLPEEEQEEADDQNTRETWCSELPPSDSFADFRSAPFEGLEGSGDSWVAFGLQEECEDQQESWSAFDEEQQTSTAVAASGDSLQNNSVSVTWKKEVGSGCKLQNLFQSTYFSEETSDVTEVVPLQVLLEPHDHGENSSQPVEGEAAAMWRHLQDTHSAHGLKVQWVGSRSNRILLDCLGIRNILFTGQKKRPMIVPMFASGLGMLEPTKDPVRPSPTSPCPLTPSSPGQGRSTLCTLVASSSSSRMEDGTSQRRASFSVTQDRALRHSRQKSYS